MILHPTFPRGIIAPMAVANQKSGAPKQWRSGSAPIKKIMLCEDPQQKERAGL
jgi:hypothetical protein